MFTLTPTQSEEARQAIVEASTRPEIHSAITALYDDLQKEIDLRRPKCILSGRCSRFEEFGHRLYVTTLELAAFLHDLKRIGQNIPAPNPGGCPFQINKLCSVHLICPFACRLFF